ncbi:MAG: DUF2851 family protein [Lentisphaeria bacterium]
MSNFKLNKLHTSLTQVYLPLRNQVTERISGAETLFENNGRLGLCQFDERFLQALWNEQFFNDPLKTVSGDVFEIISSGTWNVEAGPDFKNAIVRLAGRVCHGDIEIHRRTNDWYNHGHDDDNHYSNVILHAVWEHPKTESDDLKALPPCFEMQSFMDRPWYAASEAIDFETDYPYARQVGAGACAPYWARLADGDLRQILQIAGLARLREKAARFQRSAVARGTEQGLYEYIFEALGYKNNKENFKCLAQHVPLKELEKLASNAARRAALFGAAGFLPDPTIESLPSPTRRMTRKLWDAWWPLGRQPVGIDWQRGNCRPLNTPERRLAAGIELLQRWEWQPAHILKSIVTEATDSKDLMHRLRNELSFSSTWDAYTTLRHPLKHPARLLGESRQRDLITNVLLPAAWMLITREGRKGSELSDCVETVLLGMPRLQSNRSLKEAAHCLFMPPSRSKDVAPRACEQQGLLAIYKDFCLRLGKDCQSCPLMNSELLEKLVPVG